MKKMLSVFLIALCGCMACHDVTEQTVPVLAQMPKADRHSELKYLRKKARLERKYSKDVYAKAHLADFNKLDEKSMRDWTYIMSSNATSAILHVDGKKFNCIAEAWIRDGKLTAKDLENFSTNLKLASERGYDSVLVRYNCNDDLEKLSAVFDTVRHNGMATICVYCGKYIDKSWNPYADPKTLSEYIKFAASRSDMMLLSWKGMTQHVRLVPDEFFNFVAKEARTANPDIRIYGECFHGFLDSAQKICRTTCISIPNLTGYLVMNAGYVNSNIDFAADERYSGMIENFKSFDNIGEVVGFAPYYKSMQDARLTKEQQYECKKRVISRFAEKNMSTITYLNDGCDDHLAEHYGTTDNLIYDTTTLQEK